MNDIELSIVRAAISWFNCDMPQQGRPSGLRMLTSGDVWTPNPAELRLARRVALLLDERDKLKAKKKK